jgi:hypothetical protein
MYVADCAIIPTYDDELLVQLVKISLILDVLKWVRNIYL